MPDTRERALPCLARHAEARRPRSYAAELATAVWVCASDTAQAQKIPMIVLTGNTDETAAFAALSLDADDYLIKGNVTSTLIGRATPTSMPATLALEKSKIDVVKVVADAIELQIGLAAEKKIQLRSDLGTRAIANADSARLMQVMANLLGNAIKFTPEGGHHGGLHAFQRLGAHQRGRYGFRHRSGKLPHVFDRFYQSDRREGGAGLGLAISKGIVEGHGGHIGATSTLGEGSTFWLTLPIA